MRDRPDDNEAWEHHNRLYNKAALEWMRALLRARLADAADESPTLRTNLRDLENLVPRPQAIELAAQFGMSRFELEILLLCAAAAWDPQVSQMCGVASGVPGRGAPTFALALALFEEPAWDVMAPD